MVTKSAQIRSEQTKKQAKQDLRVLVGDEAKVILRDMRRLGFAPPKGLASQKQFERYAAFLDAQSTAAKSAALVNEVAVFNANGGLMTSVLERLNKPGVKGTEFANLTTAAVRLLALAPTLADKTRADANVIGSTLPDDDRLDDLADNFGGDL